MIGEFFLYYKSATYKNQGIFAPNFKLNVVCFVVLQIQYHENAS